MASHATENLTGPDPERGAARPAAGPSLTSAYLQRVLSILQQRWPLVLTAAVLCGVFGWMLSGRLAKATWEVEGVLLYRPPPISDSQRGVYSPPSMQTLQNLITTPQTLEILREEFSLGMPLEVLERQFTVEQPRNTEKITITMKWSNGEDAAALVNRLMELFIEQVETRRRKEIEGYVGGLDASLKRTRARLEEAQRAFRTKATFQDVKDLRTEIERLRKEVAEQEALVSTRRGEYQSAQAQLIIYKESVQRLREEMKKDGGPKNTRGEAERQRKIIELEGKMKQLEVRKRQLEVQLADIRPLVSQKIVTKDKLDDLNAEILRNREEMKTTTSLLESVKTERPMDDPASGERGPLQAAETKRVDLEAQVNGLEKVVKQVEETLAAKRKRLGDMEVLLKSAATEADEVESLEKARQLQETQLLTLNQLKRLPSEFEIVTPAAVPDHAAKTTRKTLFGMAFAAPFGLFLLLLVGYEILATRGTATDAAGLLGLPVLAQVQLTGDKIGGTTQAEARGLALRLRQYVPEPGAVVLLSPLAEGDEVDVLATELGRYLGVRDEKVLLLDARLAQARPALLTRLIDRPAIVVEPVEGNGADMGELAGPPDAPPGLVQYLVFEGQNPEEFIYRTRLPAVAYMPHGGPYPVTDILATQPMQDLLTGLSKKYTLILLIGPMLAHRVETEMLAAYAQGIVVLVNGPADDPTGAGASVRSLREAQAPLLGSVVCAG